MTKRLYLCFFLAVASSYTTKPMSWGTGLQGRVSISPAKMTPLQTGLDTVPTTMEATNDAGRIGIDMTEDFIRNFLISEVEMFGNCGWEIMTISRNHARENICYKCTPIGSNAKPVFLKHSQQIRDGSHNRLRHEFEGMRVFSKYSPKEVPKILLYDDMKQILVTEWLDRYLPLSHSFGFTPPPPPLPSSSLGLNRGLSDRNMRVSPNLEVDCDTCRAMGTIMGRSHARTHRRILSQEKYSELEGRFHNEDTINLWEESLFAATLDRLSSTPVSEIEKLLALYNYDDQMEGLGSEDRIEGQGLGPLSLSVDMLKRTFSQKKEALIHADLHCNNVMILDSDAEEDDPSQRSGDRRSRPFKVINFSQCCMGPAGLDLGIFLANFLWYYAGHSEPSRRRGAVSGVMAVIDSYRSAFRVQLGSGTGSKGGQSPRQISQSVSVPVAVAVDVEEILNEALRDAMGFMGLYTLVMALEEEKEENNTSTHSEKKSKTQGEGKVEGERADQKNDDFPGIYSGEDGSISYTETRRPVEMLSLKDMPEMKWGNTPTRSTFVRRRQVEMSVIALMMYTDSVLSSECDAITIKQIEAEEIEKGKGMDNESDQVGMIDNTLNTRKSKKPTNIINAQSFASIFLADDKIMASDHMTEFWY